MRFALMFVASLVISSTSFAREQIRIVGSSTVFPFVAAAAEQYSDKTGHRAPIVESIGTGAGMVEFCKGAGIAYPDMINASRPMVDSEKKSCKKNKVGAVIEVPIGMDGIVIASGVGAKELSITKEEMFLALAKDIPVDGELVANPYSRWNQVNPKFPATKIEVYGPKSTSGTRDAFVEMMMEVPCKQMPEYRAKYTDKKQLKKACHMIREDGHYIEAGENDNLIVQKLSLNNNAFGIFGFSYLDQNIDKVVAHKIEGVVPEFENIADGTYPVARTLYVYVKQAHVKSIKGIKTFLKELTSEDALSDEGYLTYKGLIPYTFEKREEVRRNIASL